MRTLPVSGRRPAARRRTFYLAAVLAGALLAARPAPAAPADGDPAPAAGLTAKAYIVVDDKTGHVLAGSHADDKLQVASLTKIATAVVVLDWVRLAGHTLDETVTVPDNAPAGDPASAGLQAGDEVSLRDLLYAALLQSDNVAADAMAEFVGRDLLRKGGGGNEGNPREGQTRVKGVPAGTVRFVAEMNALARHLHMDHTRFLNPSGLDGTERPYSTAADLARLTRQALSKADFRFFIAQKERRISVRRAGQGSDFLVHNTNERLGTDRIDGVKTGSTARAGQCVILSAARDPLVQQEGTTSHITPRRLIVVVLNSANRFDEGVSLLARGVTLYDGWAAAGYPDDPKQSL